MFVLMRVIDILRDADNPPAAMLSRHRARLLFFEIGDFQSPLFQPCFDVLKSSHPTTHSKLNFGATPLRRPEVTDPLDKSRLPMKLPPYGTQQKTAQTRRCAWAVGTAEIGGPINRLLQKRQHTLRLGIGQL
jgi:hypothetical protein